MAQRDFRRDPEEPGRRRFRIRGDRPARGSPGRSPAGGRWRCRRRGRVGPSTPGARGRAFGRRAPSRGRSLARRSLPTHGPLPSTSPEESRPRADESLRVWVETLGQGCRGPGQDRGTTSLRSSPRGWQIRPRRQRRLSRSRSRRARTETADQTDGRDRSSTWHRAVHSLSREVALRARLSLRAPAADDHHRDQPEGNAEAQLRAGR